MRAAENHKYLTIRSLCNVHNNIKNVLYTFICSINIHRYIYIRKKRFRSNIFFLLNLTRMTKKLCFSNRKKIMSTFYIIFQNSIKNKNIYNATLYIYYNIIIIYTYHLLKSMWCV